MKVEFRHKGCHVQEDTRELVTERLGHLVKLIDEPISTEVFFSEATAKAHPDRYGCEVTISSHGHVVRARAAGAEQVQAFDRVEVKLRHQLERLKGRLLLRSHPHHRPSKAETAAAQNGHDERAISKNKRFHVVDLTPEEAAFQMEMLSHSFFLFKNIDTGEAAVVYRREDGSVGLIDAEIP